MGMHAHNNQQLAFGNTIEAASWGASLLDATVNGMAARATARWNFCWAF
ncbi:MAG: hypothetical protein ACLRTQ_05010 [Candidatus Borkfalkia sp.]